MRQTIQRQTSKQTHFIKINSNKCIACWKCIDACQNNVIGNINLPWHKHARFTNPSNCIGCMKCLKVCVANAISQLPLKKEGVLK